MCKFTKITQIIFLGEKVNIYHHHGKTNKQGHTRQQLIDKDVGGFFGFCLFICLSP